MAEKYYQVSSEVRPGNRTTVIWHLKNWNNDEDFRLLARNANCFVKIPDVDKEDMHGHDSGSGLRFYFGFSKDTRDTTFHTQYLSLNCDQVNITKEMGILGFSLQVKFVDDKLNVIDQEKAVEKGIPATGTDDDDNPVTNVEKSATGMIIEKRFVTFADCQTHMFSGSQTTNLRPRPAELRLKISVRPILLSTVVKTADESNSEDTQSIREALKDMYLSEENYPDITLTMMEGVSLKAHKFMLAARSPTLRSLLRKQINEKDSDGMINLPEVTGYAMKVVLHWMYTGDLHENAGKYMANVLEAAIHFRLGKMIQLLEWKLEMGCNKENMFEFYRVAQANGMKTAADEISKFIDRNIPKDGLPVEN